MTPLEPLDSTAESAHARSGTGVAGGRSATAGFGRVIGRYLLSLGLLGGTLPIGAQQSAEVNVSGVAYMSYRYQLDGDSSLGGAHGNNFDVDRAYLTVSGRFEHGLSTRITTDIDPSRSTSTGLAVRLKYAYLAWQPPGSPLTLKFGAIETPLVAWLETLWGYRMQGTVALDRAGYLVASDFGVSLAGRWGGDRIDAVVGLYNGEGYGSRPGDAGKDLAARLSVRLSPGSDGGTTGGLRLTGYVHHGRATGGGVRQRLVGVVSWQTPRYTLAAEYGVTRDSIAPTRPDVHGKVASLYAVYSLPDGALPISVLARIDRWDPDTDISRRDPDPATDLATRVIAGVGVRLTPQLRLLVDVDLLSLAHGSSDNAWNATRRTLLFQTEFTF